MPAARHLRDALPRATPHLLVVWAMAAVLAGCQRDAPEDPGRMDDGTPVAVDASEFDPAPQETPVVADAALEAEALSPWSEARERDVGFRAAGSEPGWLVEVDMGETPEMRLVLDYGERQVTVARSEPFTGEDGVSGFRGEVDGEPVELAIRREACADPMSGEAFDARATLDYQGRHYEACGRYLWD